MENTPTRHQRYSSMLINDRFAPVDGRLVYPVAGFSQMMEIDRIELWLTALEENQLNRTSLGNAEL